MSRTCYRRGQSVLEALAKEPGAAQAKEARLARSHISLWTYVFNKLFSVILSGLHCRLDKWIKPKAPASQTLRYDKQNFEPYNMSI